MIWYLWCIGVIGLILTFRVLEFGGDGTKVEVKLFTYGLCGGRALFVVPMWGPSLVWTVS